MYMSKFVRSINLNVIWKFYSSEVSYYVDILSTDISICWTVVLNAIFRSLQDRFVQRKGQTGGISCTWETKTCCKEKATRRNVDQTVIWSICCDYNTNWLYIKCEKLPSPTYFFDEENVQIRTRRHSWPPVNTPLPKTKPQICMWRDRKT